MATVEMSPRGPEPQRRVGKYTVYLDRRLGRGTFANVYEAKSDDGETVAAKHFTDVQAARDEAAILCLLPGHPHIVAHVDHHFPSDPEDTQEAWIFMEVMPQSLGDRLMQEGPLSEREVAACTQQLLLALSDLHAKDIVHRDVKPENVLLSATGVVKLGDFGLAKNMGSSSESGRGPAGTRWYMSEEAARGACCPGSDIFALGRTAFRMVGGNAVRGKESEDPVWQTVSPSLREFLTCCLRDLKSRLGCKGLLAHPFIAQLNNNNTTPKVPALCARFLAQAPWCRETQAVAEPPNCRATPPTAPIERQDRPAPIAAAAALDGSAGLPPPLAGVCCSSLLHHLGGQVYFHTPDHHRMTREPQLDDAASSTSDRDNASRTTPTVIEDQAVALPRCATCAALAATDCHGTYLREASTAWVETQKLSWTTTERADFRRILGTDPTLNTFLTGTNHHQGVVSYCTKGLAWRRWKEAEALLHDSMLLLFEPRKGFTAKILAVFCIRGASVRQYGSYEGRSGCIRIDAAAPQGLLAPPRGIETRSVTLAFQDASQRHTWLKQILQLQLRCPHSCTDLFDFLDSENPLASSPHTRSPDASERTIFNDICEIESEVRSKPTLAVGQAPALKLLAFYKEFHRQHRAEWTAEEEDRILSILHERPPLRAFVDALCSREGELRISLQIDRRGRAASWQGAYGLLVEGLLVLYPNRSADMKPMALCLVRGARVRSAAHGGEGRCIEIQPLGCWKISISVDALHQTVELLSLAFDADHDRSDWLASLKTSSKATPASRFSDVKVLRDLTGQLLRGPGSELSGAQPGSPVLSGDVRHGSPLRRRRVATAADHTGATADHAPAQPRLAEPPLEYV